MGAVSENATTEPGTVGWTYNVANSATQYLAVGETATESFTVTVEDGHGGKVGQLVKVSGAGFSDTPTITAGLTDAVGAVSEDATTPTLSDSGTIAFNDIDLRDGRTTGVATATGTLRRTLSTCPDSEHATTEPGTVDWTYHVDNS